VNIKVSFFPISPPLTPQSNVWWSVLAHGTVLMDVSPDALSLMDVLHIMAAMDVPIVTLETPTTQVCVSLGIT
jgi:hypothetical protein